MALFGKAGMAVSENLTNNKLKIRYLKRYKWLDHRINVKLEMMELWRSRLCKLTPAMSSIPTGGGSIYKSKDLDLIDKIVDIEAELDREIDELVRLQTEIKSVIESLAEERERTLLEYRYLQGMTFEWIASEMHYSWKQIHRLHKQALENIKIE